VGKAFNKEGLDKKSALAHMKVADDINDELLKEYGFEGGERALILLTRERV
jgi:hypothetical protein